MSRSRKQTRTNEGQPLRTAVWRAAILLVACLAPLVAGKFDYPPQGLLYLVVAATAAVAALTGRGQPKGAAGLPVLLLWALAGWTALSWFGSVYRHATELELARLIALAVFACRVSALCRDERGRQWWLIAVCLGGAIAAWIGIAQYAATPDRSWRTFSTFYNPNELATCLGMAALCAAGLAFGTDQRPIRVFALSAGIACLGGLLLTGSRTGAAAFAVGALLFAVRMGRHVWRMMTPGARWACGVLVLVVLAMGAPPLASRLSQGGAIAHSWLFRVQTWAGTARMAAARPLFGFGGGTFEYAYPKYAEVGFTRSAHQIYLQCAAEQGIPAVLLFLAAAGLALAGRPKGAGPSTTQAAMQAALVVALVHGLCDYGWQIPALALWIAGMIGGLAPPAKPAASGRRRQGRASVVLAGTAALAVWGLVGPEIVATRSATAADEAAIRGSLNRAAEHYVRAVRWSPRNEGIRLDYADVLESLAENTVQGGELVLAEAERQYRTATTLAPTHASALRRFGRFYARQGRHAKAATWLRRSTEEFPNYTLAHFELARSEEALGHTEAAEQAYRRVLQIADGPAGQLQPIPLLAFDVAVARTALHLTSQEWDRNNCTEALEFARRGLEELSKYRAGEYLQRSLARTGGIAPPITPGEADSLEAELNARAAAAEWTCGSREAFREAVAAIQELDDSFLSFLRALLPPEALTNLD